MGEDLNANSPSSDGSLVPKKLLTWQEDDAGSAVGFSLSMIAAMLEANQQTAKWLADVYPNSEDFGRVYGCWLRLTDQFTPLVLENLSDLSPRCRLLAIEAGAAAFLHFVQRARELCQP
jgi:hypothetical protein